MMTFLAPSIRFRRSSPQTPASSILNPSSPSVFLRASITFRPTPSFYMRGLPYSKRLTGAFNIDIFSIYQSVYGRTCLYYLPELTSFCFNNLFTVWAFPLRKMLRVVDNFYAVNI
jgi:hypothetical protein